MKEAVTNDCLTVAAAEHGPRAARKGLWADPQLTAHSGTRTEGVASEEEIASSHTRGLHARRNS
jgi:hypothetical protein